MESKNAVIDELLMEEQRREMQNSMLENPEVGAVISGGSGIRKMRWKFGKRGKSGGIRIIYFLRICPKIKSVNGWAMTSIAPTKKCCSVGCEPCDHAREVRVYGQEVFAL